MFVTFGRDYRMALIIRQGPHPHRNSKFELGIPSKVVIANCGQTVTDYGMVTVQNPATLYPAVLQLPLVTPYGFPSPYYHVRHDTA